MELNITPELKRVWAQTLAQLNGASRRVFMASGDPLETVQKALGMAEGMTYKACIRPPH